MKLQQNFTVQCRIHIFIMLLKMGWQYSMRILKTWCNFLVEGELRCLHCIDVCFDWGWCGQPMVRPE
jgi:hypothetical protein